MRYLLDTCIVSYYFDDMNGMSADVLALFDAYNNQFYISTETVKEMVLLYRHKKMFRKIWKSEDEMVLSLMNEHFFDILPVDKNVTLAYSRLRPNLQEDHNDPSDHIIIAHAITLKMPLVSSDRKFLFYVEQGLILVYNEK